MCHSMYFELLIAFYHHSHFDDEFLKTAHSRMRFITRPTVAVLFLDSKMLRLGLRNKKIGV